jgi:hypothetical protein
VVIVEALPVDQVEHRVTLVLGFSVTRRQVDAVIQGFGYILDLELADLDLSTLLQALRGGLGGRGQGSGSGW